MKHIEITENGKSILSVDVEDVTITERRDVTALYKHGETTPYTLAPSRVTQTVIYYEKYTKNQTTEFTTESRSIEKINK